MEPFNLQNKDGMSNDYTGTSSKLPFSDVTRGTSGFQFLHWTVFPFRIASKRLSSHLKFAAFKIVKTPTKSSSFCDNAFLDFWYEYQFVRQCTPERPFCDWKYYWCNEREWRCMSKVALGGNCTGYVGTDICHNSVCIMVR